MTDTIIPAELIREAAELRGLGAAIEPLLALYARRVHAIIDQTDAYWRFDDDRDVRALTVPLYKRVGALWAHLDAVVDGSTPNVPPPAWRQEWEADRLAK